MKHLTQEQIRTYLQNSDRQEIAEDLRVAPNTISNWRNGSKPMSKNVQTMLSLYFQFVLKKGNDERTI